MATDALLTLSGPAGNVVFKKYEIPEWVNFGGPFGMAVHRQPGGVTQIDSLGAEDSPISWDGIMLTADGAEQANLLWEMYQAGDKCTVTFGPWSFPVIISTLKIQYKATNYLHYQIELTRVISAEAAVGGAPPNDIGNANGVPGGAPT